MGIRQARSRPTFRTAGTGVRSMRRELDAHVWAWLEMEWHDEEAAEVYQEEIEEVGEWWGPSIAHHWLALDGWRTAWNEPVFQVRSICLDCGNLCNCCVC